MVWGAIIGGAVSLIGSKMASDAQSKGASQAAGVSREMYEQTRSDLAPWRGVGGGAMTELGALYGLNAPASSAGTGNALWGRIPQNIRSGVPEFQGRFGGRNGDTEIAHVAPGETIVPVEVMQRPRVQNALKDAFMDTGNDPARYVVGLNNSVNPRTGMKEFYSGGSAGGMDTIGGDWDRSFPGRERDLGGRGDGKDPTDINRVVARNPSQGFSRVAPISNVPEDYNTQENALARFYDSPDYLTAYDAGLGAVERSAAARGGLFSGNTLAALQDRGMQFGGNIYNQYANRLLALSGLGQNAAAQTGNAGIQVAGQVGNAALYGGQARAGGYEGMANAVNSAIGNYEYDRRYNNYLGAMG